MTFTNHLKVESDIGFCTLQQYWRTSDGKQIPKKKHVYRICQFEATRGACILLAIRFVCELLIVSTTRCTRHDPISYLLCAGGEDVGTASRLACLWSPYPGSVNVYIRIIVGVFNLFFAAVLLVVVCSGHAMGFFCGGMRLVLLLKSVSLGEVSYCCCCCCCCCCCSHVNWHNQVRGHRTGSSHWS